MKYNSEMMLQDVLFAIRRLSVKIDVISRDIEFLKVRVDAPQMESMYNLSEVCHLLDVSKRTMQRLRSEKTIKYYIMNGKSYYTKAEVERLLKARKGRPVTHD